VKAGRGGYPDRVEPLPEVQAGVDRLAELLEEPRDLAGRLDAVGQVVRGLVPSTIGVSITVVVDGDSFTLTATTETARAADASQYVDEAGPCLDAVSNGAEVNVPDVLDEARWQAFAEGSAAAGIRSSLSLPLRDDTGRVTGGLNIYAADPHAFDRRRDILAGIFGAQVAELVANADLSFRTRDQARELPERLEARRVVDIAVGVLAATWDWTPEQARQRMRDAAARAGVRVERVASILVHLAS
jgi:GAF domain-containing protein